MKLTGFKRFLVILLALSAAVYLIYLARVYFRVHNIFHVLTEPRFWAYAAAAFVLILLGHILRAFKFQRLLLPVKHSGVRTQFQSLLIGYLFNTVLPLRLGEVVRAVVLGRSLKFSSSFMFALIVLERAFDGIILGALAVIIGIAAGPLPARVKATLITLGLLISAVAVILGLLLALLYRQDTQALRFWHRFTEAFNYRLKNSLRFKLWSVIYGLNKTLTPRRLAVYAARSLAMWALYLLSLMVLAVFFFPGATGTNFVRSLISFLGVSVPSGPAFLGSFQAITDPLFQALQSGRASLDWLVASWMMLAVPSSIIGAGLLLRHRTDYSKLAASQSEDALRDKLARTEDISQEFDAFLDQYFRRNTLSHIINRLEINENIKLIKYFKGGSNAATILVHQNDDYVVKKIIPIQYKDRLKAQAEWLKKHEPYDKIVNVTGEREGKDFYYVDIEYHSELVPFFDYLHSESLASSKGVLSGVFNYLFDHVYELEPPKQHEAATEALIKAKVFGKLNQASRLDHTLARLRDYATLNINGTDYYNVNHCIDRIKNEPHIWHDVTTFRHSPTVHGDATIDNILTSTSDHSFKIIDPVDQNEVESPVIDFGRMYQSLAYGYEFLCRDDAAVTPDGNSIRYEDSASAAYNDLYKYFRDLAKELLEPEEFRSILFHTAVNYSRISTHRIEINPSNTAKFYAVSVRAFNDFLAQYDK